MVFCYSYIICKAYIDINPVLDISALEKKCLVQIVPGVIIKVFAIGWEDFTTSSNYGEVEVASQFSSKLSNKIKASACVSH